MRKILVAFAVLGLINGCAWLGFGDESSTTTQTETAQAAEPEVTSEPAAEAPKAAAKKETKKVASKGAKSEARIKAELDAMGAKLVAQSARTLLPNKANKNVKQVGGQWVATYMNVDTQHVTTELRPGSNGQYVGFIRYQEEVMECKGPTREAALSAPCQKVGARRLNELIRYDGKEWQD